MLVLFSSQFTPGVYFPPNTDSHCLDRAIFILIPQVGVVILFYIASVILTWGIKDAFNIKTELKVLTIVIPVLFVPFAIRTATTLLTPYVDGSYFSLPIIAISFTVTIVFPVIMSYRLERARFDKVLLYSEDDIDLITNNLTALFRFVMDNSLLKKEFQQFCVDSFCVENFLFYQDVGDYQQLETSREREQAALKIMEVYIGEDTPRQINIDMKAEIAVKTSMNEKLFESDLFLPALG